MTGEPETDRRPGAEGDSVAPAKPSADIISRAAGFGAMFFWIGFAVIGGWRAAVFVVAVTAVFLAWLYAGERFGFRLSLDDETDPPSPAQP